MGALSFPVVSGAAVVAGGDTTAKHEPGTVMDYRNSEQWSFVEYVQLDNNGCSQGIVLINNYATLKQFSVAQAASADQGCPIRGISVGTIASQKFGWMYIGGYVEKAAISNTAASGEYLMVSGSATGQLTSDKASAFNTGSGTLGGDNSTSYMVVAVARTAIASAAIGSISLVGVWG